MDFIVRPARFDDIPEMCGLLNALFSIESDFSADLQRQADGLSLLVGDRSGLSAILVAAGAAGIAGICSVQTVISTAQGGPVGLLEDLIVRKDCRGNGIGTKLLFEITEWCRVRNISRIQLLRDADNLGAREFYSSNGWLDTNLVCMRRLF
ncbi:MAG: GNAT family N-acetyltransferase [Nitrospiraceae bacterium]|nr:GNAT family N-acetyltransferase [Nitrospiraceae bacterium]